ncbi:fluoride efflux transporter CrcB [Aeromicrobium endophyticum]|uniref:Fluoride-specific ion channel FluC n=1 Tax=Aeromicrobium endophyticum TaxID=2292704 RepID=A0A371P5G1_9ACTN|nr:fluoride efflux transporter CrcB [Aeromicrobium endophyticum]REK70780.1 fluoride efflux transporter CrcB [Aeromicrobium endophyticum]
MKSFLVVVAGGAAGSLVRYGIGEWLNPGHELPVGTLLVNVTGAFVLGALLAALALRSDDSGRHRQVRLLLGTGFLGGYTTYSSLAVETDTLLRDGHVALGAAYAIGSVALGLVAALTGVAAGRAVTR